MTSAAFWNSPDVEWLLVEDSCCWTGDVPDANVKGRSGPKRLVLLSTPVARVRAYKGLPDSCSSVTRGFMRGGEDLRENMRHMFSRVLRNLRIANCIPIPFTMNMNVSWRSSITTMNFTLLDQKLKSVHTRPPTEFLKFFENLEFVLQSYIATSRRKGLRGQSQQKTQRRHHN